MVLTHVGRRLIASLLVVEGRVDRGQDEELPNYDHGRFNVIIRFRSSPSASQSFADAYAAHYASENLTGALRAHREVIAAHPGAPEAEYSGSQIKNIMRAVVPLEEVFKAQVERSLRFLGVESGALDPTFP